MAKKIKKSKGGGKGKKGKGKKGKSKSSKDEKIDVLAEAIANAQLWENRLGNAVTAKNEYRENTRTLLHENEQLQNQVSLQEKDTIEVISFLKDEDMKKDTQINKLESMVRDLKKDFKNDRQALIDEYTREIESLQGSLNEKTNEVKLMQAELKLVKEFRRRRAQMQKELDEIKNSLYHTDKTHQETLEKMERKFFEEKIRLQNEASKKISELAERAHTEAVANLDDTTKAIYMENVRLNEALNYHVKSGEELAAKKGTSQDLDVKNQLKDSLVKENKNLTGEKEMNSLIVEEKIIQSKQLQKLVKELRSRIQDMESHLTKVVKEKEKEKEMLQQNHSRALEHNKMEVARLQRTLEMKSKEMSRVRKLAKNILDQRTEMEQFFMDSLEVVKSEIAKNRKKELHKTLTSKIRQQYLKAAETAYRERMQDAYSGRGAYPKIRTFKSQINSSTNTIFSDFHEAERWDKVDSSVDISELTWEQRERVLRLMFAKMNGFKAGTANSSKIGKLPPIKANNSTPAITDGKTQTTPLVPRPPSPPKTFITEANEHGNPV